MRKWLTINQVCEKLVIDRSTLFRLEKSGNFPKRSNRLKTPRWPEDEIELYMVEAAPADLHVP